MFSFANIWTLICYKVLICYYFILHSVTRNCTCFCMCLFVDQSTCWRQNIALLFSTNITYRRIVICRTAELKPLLSSGEIYPNGIYGISLLINSVFLQRPRDRFQEFPLLFDLPVIMQVYKAVKECEAYVTQLFKPKHRYDATVEWRSFILHIQPSTDTIKPLFWL